MSEKERERKKERDVCMFVFMKVSVLLSMNVFTQPLHNDQDMTKVNFLSWMVLI